MLAPKNIKINSDMDKLKWSRDSFKIVLLSVALVVLAGVLAYLYGRANLNPPKTLQPQATVQPTTLTISRATEQNTTGTGFTITVDNVQAASSLLGYIKALPVISSETKNCPPDNGDDYTLHFTNPESTYTANYGGCFYVNLSGSKTLLLADPSTLSGSVFWKAIAQDTKQPL